MNQEQYCREMEQVSLSAQAKTNIMNAMTKTRRRRWGSPMRLLLVAVCLCAVLITSVLAASPALREELARMLTMQEELNKALGRFEPYSQSVEGTAADQGFEIRVVSAVTDQYRMKLYIEVTDSTGERLKDEHALLNCNVKRNWNRGSTRLTKAHGLAYDEETHTVLFEYSLNGYGQAEPQETLDLEVSGIVPGVYSFESTAPMPAGFLQREALACMTLEDGQVVLCPEQTPAELEGVNGVTLSSLGYTTDGTLQVIFQMPDGVVPYSNDPKMRGKEARNDVSATVQVQGMPELDYGTIRNVEFWQDGRLYLGQSWDGIGPEYWDRLEFDIVHGTYVLQRPIEGSWRISFPVDNTRSTLEVEIQNGLPDLYPQKLILSPLGAAATGLYRAGYFGNCHFALVMQDGTVQNIGSRGVNMTGSSIPMGGEGSGTLGSWRFDEALDVTQVAGVELANWYFDVTGENAGVLRRR